MKPKDMYFMDYPKVPLGGNNPYYACAFCGASDPHINGSLNNHFENCEYVDKKLED